MQLADLHNLALQRNAMVPFLKAIGLSVPLAPDAEGWVKAIDKDGIEYYVNCTDGTWRLENGTDSTFYALHAAVEHAEESDLQRMEALKVICQAAGLAAEFEQCAAAPATDGIILLSTLSQIDDPRFLDKRVKVPVRIMGSTSVVYDSPIAFIAECVNDKKCGKCHENKARCFGVGDAIHCDGHHMSQTARQKAMKDILGCTSHAAVKLSVTKKATYREIWIGPLAHCISVENDDAVIVDGAQEHMSERKAFLYVDAGCKMPTEFAGYRATGWVRTSPKDSTRTLLIEKLEPVKTELEAWKLEDEWPRVLRMKERGLKNVLEDLTMHRTRMPGREDLLLLNLLVFCSVRNITFNMEPQRGWLTAAIVGDSSVGKSVTYKQISTLIGEGDSFNAETARRTGLTYATIQRPDGGWKTQPGAFPRADSRILCVDETQKLARDDDLGTLGTAMDSGRMEVKNVAHDDYDTRVRSIFMANCADNRVLATYPWGCTAFKDIFPYNFIRRIDLGMCLRRPPNADYNKQHNDSIPPAVMGADLRALVYWAWTAKPEQVTFGNTVTRHILAEAKALADEFGRCEDLPLVCPADCRKTIARVAVAFGVLTASIFDNGTLDVTDTHVVLACDFMRRLYRHPDCALDAYSTHYHHHNRMDDYDDIRKLIVDRLLKSQGAKGGDPFGLLLSILQAGRSENTGDLCVACGVNDVWIADAVALLRARNLVTANRNRVTATQKLLCSLARMTAEDSLVAEVLTSATRRK